MKWAMRLATFLLLVMQVWFLFVIFHFPYIDLSVRQSNGQWIVDALDQRSPLHKYGISSGDMVINIDGKPVGTHVSVQKWGSIDQAKSILFLKEGTALNIVTSEFTKLTAQDISSLCGGIFGILVSLMFFVGIKYSKSSKYLALVFLNIGLTFMSLGASIRGDQLGKMSIGVCITLIPVVLLHFLIVFLSEKGNIKIRTNAIVFLYFIIILSTIPKLFYFTDIQLNQAIHQFMSKFELVFFSFGIITNIIVLTIIYLKFRTIMPELSALLKWIGIFFTISTSPIVLLTFVSKIVLGHEWIASELTSWAVLLFPLSFTYLLHSKKIYDIDLVVRRFLLSTIVSIIPSLIIIGVASLLVSTKLKFDHLILAFIFTLLLFSVTLYTLEYFSTRLEKIVFPRKYFLQLSIKKISKKLGLISSTRELKEIILVDIIEILKVHGGAIVFQYNDSIEIISEGLISHEKINQTVLGAQEKKSGELSYFELTHNQNYSSYLMLTNKKNNLDLGSEEKQWLELIVSYLSVSMENLFLIRQMSLKLEQLANQIPTNENSASDIAWFRKLMFELQEKERFRIATDLHDTTMQDLFFLKRKLAALLDKYADDWQDSEQAKSLLDYIDIINMNLRQSCFELHPYLLQELGLVRTIDKLIELEQTTLPFEIEFRYGGIDMIESCDIEMKRHLFRVFQELVNNAKKHSNATKVYFNLSAASGKLMVQYLDDGLGFTSGKGLVREIGGSHIGLEQLKSRILSMRGVFEIKSGQGSGMSFSAAIPLKEGMTA